MYIYNIHDMLPLQVSADLRQHEAGDTLNINSKSHEQTGNPATKIKKNTMAKLLNVNTK